MLRSYSNLKMKVGKKRNNGRQGFTIVEVVVAVGIVSIAAAGLMGCLSYAYLVTQLTRENQRATQIILERSEAIRLCNWDQVRSNGFIPASFTDYYDPTAANTTAKGAVYTGTVGISNVPFSSSYSTNMRSLTLSIQWKTGRVSRSRTCT